MCQICQKFLSFCHPGNFYFVQIHRLNFSDAEIEIFCAKYDRDGDFQFDLEEINAIENGLEMEMEGEQNEEKIEIPIIPGADQITNEPPPPPPNQGMLTT